MTNLAPGGGIRGPRAASEPGLAAREMAASLVAAVLNEGRTLDDALTEASSNGSASKLADRDRAFARLVATTVLRRAGEIEAVLAAFLEKPLPARPPLLKVILLAGAAQLLFLGTPPHAAVNVAVEQCRRSASARRFDKLTNAVLRRVASEGSRILSEVDPIRANIPAWLLMRWEEVYGPDLARRIAGASLTEAALDLSVKSDAAGWAARLGGVVLRTGSVRLASRGRIENLEGYADGQWWVQDAAAALPARLFGNIRGLDVADLCAAPGGKTAQLVAAGANVIALDSSPARLDRLRANLRRLDLGASLVCADATAWTPVRSFDAVLLDVPCTATGTIRRHPDILHLRRPSDVAQLRHIQDRLLDSAARHVKPGGWFVYCACSLDPEEGSARIGRFLEQHPMFARAPVFATEFGGRDDWITGDGDLRTLPCHSPALDTAPGGLDGFYAARLRRTD